MLRAVACAALLTAPACAATTDRSARSSPPPTITVSPTTVGAATIAPRAAPLAADQAEALAAVAAVGPQRVPVAIMRALVERNAFSHAQLASPATTPVAQSVRTALAHQLDTARAAALRLMRLSRLERAGYYLGSFYVPGVGAHYIDWHDVGRPFDPARPAMLLVDVTPGHIAHLAGFSYWVRSATPPAGFAGDADRWHRHFGLCFERGILEREGLPSAADCPGTWINGSDLWMLHTWVVPHFENAEGVFAPRNPDLCPARLGNENTFC